MKHVIFGCIAGACVIPGIFLLVWIIQWAFYFVFHGLPQPPIEYYATPYGGGFR